MSFYCLSRFSRRLARRAQCACGGGDRTGRHRSPLSAHTGVTASPRGRGGPRTDARRSHLTPVTHCSSHTHWVGHVCAIYDRKKSCVTCRVGWARDLHRDTEHSRQGRPFLFIYLGSRLARCARTKSRDHAGKRKREESLNTQAFTVKCSFLAHLVAFCATTHRGQRELVRRDFHTRRRRAGAAGHMAATAARKWARASCGGCTCTEASCARQSRAGVWPAPTRSGRACDGALPAPHESQVGGSLAFCESESRRPDPEEWQQRVAFRE